MLAGERDSYRSIKLLIINMIEFRIFTHTPNSTPSILPLTILALYGFAEQNTTARLLQS